MDKLPELLAPAGNYSKLETAFYFGADAVYGGGEKFGLRAYAGNFSPEEMIKGVEYAHSLGKKFYVTANVFARDTELEQAKEYFKFLEKIKVDAAIVSDLGLLSLLKENAPHVQAHISTQAGITNSLTAKTYKALGASRVILARELSLDDIKRLRDALDPEIEVECFVHGAMCVSFSGRCLLSNFLTGRDGNRGECVQACRWAYELREVSRPDSSPLILTEDKRGAYIMNSKDLNMIRHLNELRSAGITSFKIEGRMKTEYYVASVVNAYRRAIDLMDKPFDENIAKELEKVGNRGYTTGFYFNKDSDTSYAMNYENSLTKGSFEFTALVKDYDENTGFAVIEQRNRFKKGDVLELLSPTENFNKKISVDLLMDENGNDVSDAKLVQQTLLLKTDVKMQKGDILRKSSEK